VNSKEELLSLIGKFGGDVGNAAADMDQSQRGFVESK
jgi:hypothetical protein